MGAGLCLGRAGCPLPVTCGVTEPFVPCFLLQARSLLYQFRLLTRIPCSLRELCRLCGPGMWDSGYIPAVECTGHHPGPESCPYGGTVEAPSPKSPQEARKDSKTPREGFGLRR